MARLDVISAIGLALALACGAGGSSKVYGVRGVVQEIHAEHGQIVIDHEDIPGLMPAMTMNFDVADPALLETLEPGQEIEFRMQFDGKAFRVLDAEVLGEAEQQILKRRRLAAVARPAPDFRLTDQDGAERSLADWRGKAVLLDFIYTNCPGPCPLLTSLHVRVQQALPAEAREGIWFASISLDPERDTPEAMRAYAEARGADLSRWSFLTGEKPVVDAVIKSYGVGSIPGEDGEIEHMVVTFLIDPEGRIVKHYMGLEHEAPALAEDLAALAAAPAAGQAS